MTPIIATALALRANLDKQHPYSFVKSISNVAIDTVDGIKYPRTWDLTDPDTEVGFLNAHDVTSVIPIARITSSEARLITSMI